MNRPHVHALRFACRLCNRSRLIRFIVFVWPALLGLSLLLVPTAALGNSGTTPAVALGTAVHAAATASEPAHTSAVASLYLPLIVRASATTLNDTTTDVPTSPSGADPQTSDFVARVVARSNDYRSTAGCPALVLDDRLTSAAQRHSDDMARNNFMAHTGSDGSSPWDRIEDTGYRYRLAAENVAAGYASPEEVVEGWMQSAGHRANILDCDLREIGVGYGYNAASTYRHYWTQNFATPR